MYTKTTKNSLGQFKKSRERYIFICGDSRHPSGVGPLTYKKPKN